MRLWPLKILKQLPRQQLLGQHRECCALRGKGWGKKHSVVNYIFEHPFSWLVLYHDEVMDEMKQRGYHIHGFWKNPVYRGKNIGFDTSDFTKFSCPKGWFGGYMFGKIHPVYPEHNEKYLNACLENLKRKNVVISLYE